MQPQKTKSPINTAMTILGIWIAALLLIVLGMLLAAKAVTLDTNPESFSSLSLVVIDPVIILTVFIMAIITSVKVGKRMKREGAEGVVAGASVGYIVCMCIGLGLGAGVWATQEGSPERSIFPYLIPLLVAELLAYILIHVFKLFSKENKSAKTWLILSIAVLLSVPPLVFYYIANNTHHVTFDPVCCSPNQTQ